MKQIALIVGAGTTDLQLLLENEGEQCRASIDAGLREFHEALLSGNAKYVIDDPVPSLPEADRRKAGLKWKADQNVFEVSDGYQVVQRDGAYILIPEKLAEVVDNLQKEQDTEIVGAVVFNTHRTDKSLEAPYWNEPIACGPILSEWLANKLQLQKTSKVSEPNEVAMGKASWVDFLIGSMKQESGPVAPLNREAVRRIDQAIRCLSNWQVDGDFRACLSLGGGLPKFKEVFVACAQLHFPQGCFSREKGQYQEAVKHIDPDKERPSPTESFRARHHAIQLVREGDFAGEARVSRRRK